MNIFNLRHAMLAGSALCLALGLNVAAPAQESQPALRGNEDRPSRAELRERLQQRVAQREEQLMEKAPAPGTIRWTAGKVGEDPKEHWGVFKDWRFTKVDLPDGDLTKGTIALEIDLTSMETDNERLTGHLKSADFFTMEKFPKATVTLSNAKVNGEVPEGEEPKNYMADGTLTMMGVDQPLNVTFTVLNKKPLTVKGQAVVNREAHGMGAGKYSQEQSQIMSEVPVEFEAVVPPKLDMGPVLKRASRATMEEGAPASRPARELRRPASRPASQPTN